MFGNSGDAFQGFSNVGDGWQKNITSGFSQAAFGGNSTFGVINEFKFLAARSIRTSTIVLAIFNIVAAFATAAGILFDCYTKAKRNSRGAKVNVFTCVQGPEVFPFILSIAITLQGIVFAVAQAQGLDGLFTGGCSLISQFVWIAVFIVPYIQLVFGLEVALRGVRKKPFPARGKWTVAVCLSTVKILLLITGLVGFFIRAPNFCFASLFWYVAKWAEGGFALLLIIAVVLSICITIICLKLRRSTTIETSERVGASRMVYYLALAVLQTALTIPFFIYLTFSTRLNNDGGSGLTLSMIATVVANVTGLMTGGLHLFLRSNTISTIGPKDKVAEYERQKLKYQIRMKGPYEMDFNGHMRQPVSGPQQLHKSSSQRSLIGRNKSNIAEVEASTKKSYRDDPPNPLRSHAVSNLDRIPRTTESTQVPAPAYHGLGRRPSAAWSLFPGKNRNTAASTTLLPSTTYSPNSKAVATDNTVDLRDTLIPPSLRLNKRHRRDSSVLSSATVQIGLRFSNVEDMPPMAVQNVIEAEKVHTLSCPNKANPEGSYRPSPLVVSSIAEHTDSFPPSRSQSPSSATSAAGSWECRMKNLPPVPRWSHTVSDSECTLTPMVYDPNSPTRAKISSPRAIGFQPPPRSNTTPVQGDPAKSPPPQRSRGSSDGADIKSEWI